MTDTQLVLQDVCHRLPDGTPLFSNLNEQFDQRPTGLVGRNGVGKTVLARIMAGLLAPSAGRCLGTSRIHYQAQQVTHPAEWTVADLAGVRPQLDALSRIEAGSSAAEDFDAVAEGWDLRYRLCHELAQSGLANLDADTPARSLSGGEAMRVSLAGARLSGARFLILDEPSNHLDAPSRQMLIDQIQLWRGGLLVISHDRQLLQSMERIVELSSLGLRSYTGNYTVYRQQSEHQRQTAQRSLEQARHTRQRGERTMLAQRERQARRQAQGRRQSQQANQAKILIDRQKERSETSTGALARTQAATRSTLDQCVREAAQQVEQETGVHLQPIILGRTADRRVAVLEDVEVPFGSAASQPLNLMLTGRQRIGVTGPNGSGKSTLLKVLAGQLDPVRGRNVVTGECAYLDQRLQDLKPEASVFAQLRSANPVATAGELRMRLAHLGLDADMINRPSGLLSGGERLKAALAVILYASQPPQLLLLDEPSNHLDLPSAEALESMLCGYPGTLMVISHDEAFLDKLALTNRLVVDQQGWQLKPW